MDDRELLERAARAAGINGQWAAPGELGEIEGSPWGLVTFLGFDRIKVWNPLTDDGDALRLAVKLEFELTPLIGGYGVGHHTETSFVGLAREHSKEDPLAATRRAIVRAAAELSRRG